MQIDHLIDRAPLGGRFFLVLLAAWLTSGCAQQPAEPATAQAPWYPAANPAGDPLFAVFEGRVPCTDAAHAGCEKIKVALALYRQAQSQEPTTYMLARIYVADSPEGSRLLVSGRWHEARGTGLDQQALVVELDQQAPAEFQRYWALGPEILFLLDERRQPRVGTASWSYVLNRTAPTRGPAEQPDGAGPSG